ncbi:nicotinamide mononucleotide transporter [Taibaiella lutea]|uniref:Nicotinamide riboside transporter PnuC n=1 Tax=Taibaiella lutea TaxID=2608001 RepID=A0A5M6CTJ3_9BACT|nr:nicotinamide riboside transporter PnuC [Taibaiella lutea]KAA5537282.1 nicotinamide mononucleotide transporter [Taibaiella lutea]
MNWQEMLDYIVLHWQRIIEIVSVVFGVTEVLLSYRNNVLLYPAGIISCCLSIFLMYESKLYAESGLSAYYFIMSIWGWIQWQKRTRTSTHLPITKANPKDWGIVTAICLGGFVMIFLILKNFTDSPVPIMDAFVSATAWSGMYLLARRKLENWILLNISNIVAIPLLFYKGLSIYALLTIVLFIVAVFGYFKWKRIMKAENTETALGSFDIQMNR